jgi:hypothetical protein
MDFFQNCGSLLQSEQDILLDESKLDIARECLQLCQLLIRLRQQRLLVFLPPQCKQSLLFMTRTKTFSRDLRLSCRDRRYTLLVLV